MQAAVAAVHAEAPSAGATDWQQILALYDLLEQIATNPMISLNRAVAAGMVEGPRRGPAILDELEADHQLTRHHRLHAVRAHLLEMAGYHRRVRDSYIFAARLATSIPEQNYLRTKAEHLCE